MGCEDMVTAWDKANLPPGRPMNHRELQHRDAIARAANLRWSAKGKAKVLHPMWGEVIVPCASGLAAVQCAAEIWNVDPVQIMDARVEACDQNMPVAARPGGQEDTNQRKALRSWMVIHPAHGYVIVEAEDITEAIWNAAGQWGTDPRQAAFHQGCTVRARR